MRRLYRSQSDGKVAGICAGFGELLDVDHNLVRLVVVFLLLATGLIPVLLTYLVGWVLIPLEPVQPETKKA